MDQISKQASIEKNLDKLTKLTKNFSDIIERLQDYDVLTASEIEQINSEESSIDMLYLTVARKPVSNFDLLLYVLQDTDNEMLAKLLENSFKAGERSLRPSKDVGREVSQERYYKEDSGLTLISGGEMGIAEILQDYTKLRDNWKLLFSMLKLPNACLNSYKFEGNFIIQATLILRDWSSHLKKRATVENLCRMLDSDGFEESSVRIRKMFDGYMDSGFAFEFPGSFTIKGKITVISSILDNNPSFCFHPERLLLMLNLPLESLSQFVHDARFLKVAEKMLTRWSEDNPKSASTDHLASLLALNGHFHTCDKISAL